LPVRYPWARDYRGSPAVVYGHTPTPRAEWINNTICLTTGCVSDGSLTALRHPEWEIVSVPAAREYYPPVRPLTMPSNPPAPSGVLTLALGLIRDQYAPVGVAAGAALPAAPSAVDAVAARGLDVSALRNRLAGRLANAASFQVAYQRYCWPVWTRSRSGGCH
jgi:hypothetical protein